MPRREPDHRVGDAQALLAPLVRPVDEAGRAEIDARVLPGRSEVGLGEWLEHGYPLSVIASEAKQSPAIDVATRRWLERKRVVEGKRVTERVELGGRGVLHTKKTRT